MSNKVIWTLEAPDGKRYVGSSPVGTLQTYHIANRDPVKFMERIDREIAQQKAMDDRRDMNVANAVREACVKAASEHCNSMTIHSMYLVNLLAVIATVPIEQWIEEHIRERP